MCGIVGFLDPQKRFDDQTLLRIATAMADEVVHRGPDDSGTFADAQAGLAFGFRRLSIIDLTAAGHQPMSSASGRSTIVFNGEIYNADDLRHDLVSEGVPFRGRSDTEVLIEACESWGVRRTLERLVGMFAFAVYDHQDRRLTLARDRLGKKPLYIAKHNGAVLFASQPRSFLPHPLFEATINTDTMAAYVRFGYVPSPLSIYRGVEQLSPGSLAVVEADGRQWVERYWKAEEAAAHAKAEPWRGSDGELLDRLEARIADAVSLRMIADVPLGAFLSGGIDSSLVVSLMQRASSQPVKTFSIGFSVEGYDEAPHAKAVAQHLKTDHHEAYLTAEDALATIPELATHYDEPFADSSQIPTLLVSRLARQHVTVALSGDGGDELFGGYPRYGQMESLMLLAGRNPQLAGPAARFAQAVVSRAPLQAVGRMFPSALRMRARTTRWLGRAAHVDSSGGFERSYRQLVQQGPDPGPIMEGITEPVADLWEGSLERDFPGAVERCQIIDSLTYLPDDILVKVDRASMGVSLEARAPLLDHRVFDAAWRLPPHMKRRDGVTKWALRELLYRHVPRAIVDRPKMGFGVPIGPWLRGPLRDWAEDLLSPRELSESGIFRSQPVRALWDRHLAGEHWEYALWCILSAQAWRRHWLGRAQHKVLAA
jgi:asparagine synthase (glutamine-hydrolysing)